MRFCLSVICLFLTALYPGNSATAGVVTVTSSDGTLSISGELLSFDGRYMRVDSIYGIVTLDADRVDCTGKDCPVAGDYVPDLMISGSDHGADRLLATLLESFAAEEGYGFVRQDEDATHFVYLLLIPEQDQRVARIRFRLTSSREGFADLVAEQADMTLALREPTEAERAIASDAGVSDFSDPRYRRIIARDAVVAIVHEANPVRNVTLEELSEVFSGTITNWQGIGGPDEEIALHLPGADTGLAGLISGQIDAVADQAARRHEDVSAMARAVAADPFAIGVTLRSAVGGTRALGVSDACGFVVEPSILNVKSGSYPLSVSHGLFLPARRLPSVGRNFVDYLGSAKAQATIRAAGFADFASVGRPMADQGDRLLRAIDAAGPDISASALRDAVGALRHAEQLNITIRFQAGEDLLDAESHEGLRRIAGEIATGGFDDRTLILAGFSDSEGSASTNLQVSRQRAETARSALSGMLGPSSDRIRIETIGLGEAMPLACNEDDWGRALNRRVELWTSQM